MSDDHQAAAGAVEAVLFDFSGTLMRIEPGEAWVSAVLADAGLDVPEAERVRWARLVEGAGGLPGGAMPSSVPPELERLFAERDLDAERHRAAYSGLVRASGWPWPELVDALYERHMTPAAWRPYPDAAATLDALRAAGVRTCLISNIGWDPRPVLDAAGLLERLDGVVASFEEGVQKPDAKLFGIACERIGADPRRTLMAGDSAGADRGGEPLGIRTFLVEPLPVEERPDGFADLRAFAAARAA
ncbi:hypothetical protein BIV57_06855 [Mangrovactinospora gilvigrisea]|uniref:Hydrolase n=1 Tax=Mangrovactinospora gilvigrisea TaxID=1428644 RepID=A0A1J7C9P3_9ACTN|nr:HAD family hydrolase [Mangrovactinospora gilvigrisea]OIV38248.1 hypothetical protein BIV57_06855 [Mangrovactinospora gilvigrisea]